jgi:hypothetical protein
LMPPATGSEPVSGEDVSRLTPNHLPSTTPTDE